MDLSNLVVALLNEAEQALLANDEARYTRIMQAIVKFEEVQAG